MQKPHGGGRVVTTEPLSSLTRRRIEVLRIRQRLEALTADTFDAICAPNQPGRRIKTKPRMIFLLNGTRDPATLLARYRLIRQGRHVYARTSDVLHGRINMLNLPQAVVDEWKEIVVKLESISG
jgi:hypothetical protein